MTRRLVLALLSTLLLGSAGFCAPAGPDISGTWKQSNERSTPARKGEVTLHIDQHGSDLIIETTAKRLSGPARHAIQRYTLDGKTSVSTGADGDEFHTSITQDGQSLVFSIEEHEDGRIILSKETWKLIDNGSALQRDRMVNSSAEATSRQTLIYIRQAP